MSDSSRSSWADIPENLFTEIASRTSLLDQVRCHAVCKDWSALVQKISRENYPLPWLMLFNWKKHPNPSTCRLFDPNEQKLSTREHDLTKKIFTRLERRGIDSMKISGCKNGWVIFQTSRGRRRYGNRNEIRLSIDFVIYNPFSGQFVRLPELLRTSTDDCVSTTTTTFSTTPTSSDCVFLSLHGSQGRTGLDGDKPSNITVSWCLASDKTWNEITVVDNVNILTRGLVYFDGSFYCLFICGALRSFDIATRKWMSIIGGETVTNSGDGLVVLNGKLLCVYLKYYDRKSDRKYAVASYDFSGKNWVEGFSGLENIAVLMGPDCSSFCIPAVGKARGMANSINVYNDADYHHHSYRVGVDQVRHCRQLRAYRSLPDEVQRELKYPGKVEPIWIPPVFCIPPT